jgi:hypothetical protein
MIMIALLLTLCFVAGKSQAQMLPLERTGSLIVADSTDDLMYRFTDFNLDGDYHDQGEVDIYYTGGASGHTLGVPNTVTVDYRGNVYVVDSSTDVVLAMRDMNGNGDADDSLEEWIWFDGSNATGITIWAMMGMAMKSDGTAYICQSGSGAGSLEDYVFYCHDDNDDGDVNDLNEVDYYYDPYAVNPGVSVLETPAACALDDAGVLYVADSKLDTIFRMEDLNGDGDVNDDVNGIYETRPYYTGVNGPAVPSATNTLKFMRTGHLLMADTINDVILSGYDANGNDSLDDAGEVIEYLTTANGFWPYAPWSLAVSGTNDLFWDVYCGDSGKSTIPIGDCIIAMRDKNSDGDAEDTDELIDVYNQDFSDYFIERARAIGFMKGPYLTRDGGAHIGKPVNFTLSGTVDNTYVMVFSLGTFAGYTFPPYGVIEILPPYLYIDSGTIGTEGTATYQMNVPNSGGIVGYHFYIQAVEGNDYLYLVSNTVDSEILP